MTEAKRPRGRPRKVRLDEAIDTRTADKPDGGPDQLAEHASGSCSVDGEGNRAIEGDRPAESSRSGDSPSLSPAQVVALDHDNDGHAGGSLPHKLPPREVVGLNREAMEAYSMQDQRKRKDSLGRMWSFTPGNVRDHGAFIIMCRRGEDEQSRSILNDKMGIDARIELVEQAISDLIDAV